jgi:hypothetical protein
LAPGGTPAPRSRKPVRDRFGSGDIVAFSLLASTALMLWLPRLTGPIDLRYDSGVYYVLGTALAHGVGYRLLYEPGQILALQYPPGLPSIVAAHQLALGTDDPVRVGAYLRWFNFITFALYLNAVYIMARHHVCPITACLTVWICSLTTQEIFLSDFIFAELPYSLTSVLAVYLSRKLAGLSNYLSLA